ncbi:hypothetical protein HK102_009900, partial [Quaeritorhiza haematococci]
RLDRAEHASRRKKEGAFYTPAFITRYIVGQALGRVLADRFEALRKDQAAKAKGTARRALDDPNVYDLAALNEPQRKALEDFWDLWQGELANVRILDPSCGSGAFLIEAFEQLYQAYQRSNDRLEELRGERTLFDLDRQILQNNLYGVDLNEEAVQIGRLSLWIKTARRGKVLTSLDHSLRVGNSVVDDPAVHPRAFNWAEAFPEVFEKGGFDVVVGNPPYIRQEWITPFKPYLQKAYASYHGVADLYVYFYELGLRVLKPGGRLSFIVTNKWLKAAYGEPLRRHFAEKSWIEDVVDFGHAKQIFPDADVFPCIIVARTPTAEPAPETTRVCVIPREQLHIGDLNTQIALQEVEIERANLGSLPWHLEAKSHTDLIALIREKGIPLSKYASVKPLSGIKTGFNDAFLIDTTTKKSLIMDDPRCAELIKPYLRGQDIKRWHSAWNGLWMLAIKSSGDHRWPWSESGEKAEEIFKETYPSVYAHLMKFEEPLKKRQDQGEFWWELRSCAYWDKFAAPKIMYQEITWSLEWCLDVEGTLCNNTAYILTVADFWILAALNSPISWWYAWRTAIHGKDEALRFIKDYVNVFPVPPPTPQQAEKAETSVKRLIAIKGLTHAATRSLLDWLKVEYGIDEPSKKLKALIDFDSDSFIAE